MPKATGTRGDFKGRDASSDYRKEPPEASTPTYEELGLDKKEAMIAQQPADLPETVRESIATRLTEAIFPDTFPKLIVTPS